MRCIVCSEVRPVKSADFGCLIADCCTQVLEVMYFASVTNIEVENCSMAAEVPPQDLVPADGDHAYSVHFRGDLCGEFGVSVGAQLAQHLAANFLGEDEEFLERPEVAEVVGEMANMLCGSVLSRVKTPRKFSLDHPRAWNRLPLPAGTDCMARKLETDMGTIRVRIVLEGCACQS